MPALAPSPPVAPVQLPEPEAAVDGPSYYLAAEEDSWDYAPSGRNLCNGEAFSVAANSGDPSVWAEKGMGRVFKKARYFRYTEGFLVGALGVGGGCGGWAAGDSGQLQRGYSITDAGAHATRGTRALMKGDSGAGSCAGCCGAPLTLPPPWVLPPAPLPSLQARVPKGPEEVHTGLLGPIMRALANQTLTVHLRNLLPFPVNLEPAGLQPLEAERDGDHVPATAPGQTRTYRFFVPPAAGPAEDEPSAKLWLYRSTTDLAGHANAGLVGPILIRCGHGARCAASLHPCAAQQHQRQLRGRASTA